MIRPATEDDIPRIVELGKILHAESEEYRDISYDPDKVTETMRGLLLTGGVVFLYEQGGVIRGGLAGTIGEFWFSREKVSGDFSLFVEPESRNGMIAVKLVLAFRSWSKMRGARRINMGITTGINEAGTTKLYLSLGLRRSGTLFTEDL